MDKFFDKDEEVQEPEESQKIKVGEEEFDQAELERLVGLGKIGSEAEEKYKTKIDRVWPEFTKKSQQISDYERKIQDYETRLKQPIQQAVNQGSPVLTEDLKRQALEQAEALGIGPKAMQDVMRQVVREEIQARDLISDVNGVISQAESDGKPTATVDQILQHMQETGIKNPNTAYKDMFEEELDKWKESKLSTLRPSGMVTTQKSTAGGKYPTQPRPPSNRSELLKAVSEAMNSPEA